MSRQDDFQNVQKYVIEPMTRLYHPPAHLRTDKQAFEEAIREYHRSLAPLPATALEKGWEAVKADHKTWNWPHFQTIKDACEKHRPVHRDTPESSGKKQPWEERAEHRDKLVSEYIERFKNISTIWHEAIREGWECDLWQYAMAIAYLQAQIISGEKNLGWDGTTIFGIGNAITKEMRFHLIRDNQKQADTGTIDVAIPTNRIAEWKKAAAWRDQQKKKQEQEIAMPKAEIAKKILNPGLDEFINNRMAMRKA